MKKYLDNKKGMAMPMVLIIMVILTLFAKKSNGFSFVCEFFVKVRKMDE